MKLRLFKEKKITKRTPMWLIQYREMNRFLRYAKLILILLLLLGLALVLGFWYIRHLISVRCIW
jgi:hypothetical protein